MTGNYGGHMADNTEQDDGIIELTQAVEEDSYDAPDQDVIELTDMEEPVFEVAPIAKEPIAKESIAVIESNITQEQVDAALERVIEKKFAKKIEKILLEVMEKVLEKEIVDIRKRLQKDLNEIAIS